MDVQCERCKTEYEFDDALVSARGTTVKCTNCGHQFKIRRESGADDAWVVDTHGGETRTFLSLRELQKAILAQKIERRDTLVRGTLRRELGAIAELAPFFDERRLATTKVGTTTARGLGQSPSAPGEPIPSTEPGALIGEVRYTSPPVPPNASSNALTPPPRARAPSRPEAPPVSVVASHAPHPPPQLKSRSPTLRPGPAPADIAPPTDRDPAPPSTVRGGQPETQPKPMFPPSTPAEAAPSTPPAATPSRESLTRTAPLVISTASLPPSTVPSEVAPRVKPASAPPAQSSSPPPATAPMPPVQKTPAPAPVIDSPAAAPSAPPAPTSSPRQTPPPPRVSAATPPTRVNMPPLIDDSGPQLPEVSSPLPMPTRPLRYFDDEMRAASPSYPGDLAPVSRGRRQVGGVLIALAVIASLAIGGAVLWRQSNAQQKGEASKLDPRAQEFLKVGEKALGDGNLELAKESFDKASALAEKDPSVMIDEARLAAARADVPWLKLKLLPDDTSDEARATKESAADLSARANRAADDALSFASGDPNAVRAKIDALRLSGDREKARGYVSRVIGTASQPETAYVLAALDLAEAEPLWPSVIDRLRVAVSGDSSGRARAALVYALARSGDAANARAEVERLAAQPVPHPLVSYLRKFIDRGSVAQTSTDAGAQAGSVTSAVVDISALPHSSAGTSGGSSSPPLSSEDPRRLVVEGETARAHGDFNRARMLYSAALDKNPNDSEALNGLADLAHSSHDLNGASASYKRVLSINPTYLPALIGLADVEYEAGDVGGAQKAYKDIVDRFPEGAYPPRVKQRSEATPPPQPTPAPTAAPTAAPTSSGVAP